MSRAELRRAMAALALAAGLAGVACGSADRVRIASKPFTEGKLLAEMMAQSAEARGLPVDRLIPYGDGRTCLEAIRTGVIDAYPEYGGTLLSLAGHPALRDSDAVATQVRTLVEPMALRWKGRFGFRSDFVAVMRSDVAFRKGLSTLSDLAGASQPLRFAVDDDFGQRGTDGLPGLVRRYGLRTGEVFRFPHDAWARALEALLDGEADVAVVYETDPMVGSFGLVRLEDDLDFFPPYQPAPLVRARALERHPELGAALATLHDAISTETMRELVARVDRGGESVSRVAREFLAARGLLPGVEVTSESTRTQVTLAIRPLSQDGFLAVRAAQALRQVMPARRLRVVVEDRPADAVREGRARYGLVGAEEFLVKEGDGLVMGERLEAVGAAGARVAHLIAPTDAGPLGGLERIRLGVGPEETSSHRVATILVQSLDLGERVEVVPSEEPGAALDAGAVDALLMTAQAGHPRLHAILRREDRELRPLSAATDVEHTLGHPLLRPARIPAGTYFGQTGPVETVASQVVLATYLPPRGVPVGESGPGVMPRLGRDLPMRLPPRTAASGARALGAPEPVDPLLPSSPGLTPEAPPAREQVAGNPAAAVLNLVAIAFLVLVAGFFALPRPAHPALQRGDAGRSGASRSVAPVRRPREEG